MVQITDTTLAVYAGLVHEADLTTAQLAERLALPVGLVKSEIESLTRAGLLSSSMPDSSVLDAADPQIALALIAERAAWEFQQQMAEVENATRAVVGVLAGLTSPGEQSEVETVEWASVRAQHELVVRRATREISILLGESWYGAFSHSETTVSALNSALETGVTIRLVLTEALANDARLRLVTELSGQAVAWRFTPAVPVSMTLVDSTSALVLTEGRPDQTEVTMIGQPSLLTAVTSLFDVIWDGASGTDPGDLVAAAPVPGLALSPQQERILGLLAAGAKDQAIARATGISPRTLTRLIADIANQLGARDRFQAGAQAVRRGLLP